MTVAGRRGAALLAVLIVSGMEPASGETLRVLTYNLWHGFWRTAQKELLVLPSEPDVAGRRRADLQDARLARLAPDIVMSQEAHPLPWRARAMARALDHDSIHQLVSCGLRFLHLGVPWSIRSGLAVTARDDLRLERVGGPKLSGRLGFCSDWLGLQVEEARRALLGRISLSDGRSLLVVTTHLHSSTEGGDAREDRRVLETSVLLDAISEARRDDPEIFGVILGGDLNTHAGSRSIERLRAAGFVDAAEQAGSEFVTYDPWNNRLAARMTEAGGGDPSRSAPRRIDYLFVSRELEPFIRLVEPYGVEPNASAVSDFDSDHFGVLLELAL